ncbi:ABC transporter ATP-binding protein [Pleomorphomonas sp. JP5]|uniref:ABC transporter ATP-binding protein n=1 Tax=Pleomorphomonas sp. JP5 TaxID=2942998 RepID=UPI002044C19A|nr:ATP-binding cassette domain-containing protein [Pleomorphomonas sp. JP5]MCM5557685.1 ABC transporter ATP-binding protein [Pleomorphomonas sp. JP5]
MTAVLDIDRVSRVFHNGGERIAVLDGASLAVDAGEMVALKGPSGSGKSTLLLIAGALDRPDDGAVTVAGTRIFPDRHAEPALRALRRRAIGFVFQKANLVPFLTAAENVELARFIDAAPRGEAKARARDLLATLGLGERFDSLPSRLSGGEQQRVAVARALANQPALILADEPTAALDGARGRQVLELLKGATKSGVGVLVVTHDDRALDLFDRVVSIADGKIVAGTERYGG